MPKARSMARRKSVRGEIPSNIPIPKFMTPDEVAYAVQIKKERPDLTWQKALHESIIETKRKVLLAS